MQINYEEDNKYDQFNYAKLQQTCYMQSDLNKIHKFKKCKNQNVKKYAYLVKKKNPLQLRQLIKNVKINLLTKNFIRKVKRSKIHRVISDNYNCEVQSQRTDKIGIFIQFLKNTQGIQLSPIMLTIWSFINIIQITIMVIIFSIMTTFTQTQSLSYFVYARIFSFNLYVIDMILNFITQRRQVTGNIKNLKEIALFYLKNQFLPDIFNIIIFPLGYLFEASDITPIILVVALFKLKNNLRRFQHYEFIYINTSSKEHYYSLIKVFLLNFSIGHLLSVLLNIMVNISSNTQNWHSRLGISNSDWYEKYIWGYYWGTNIMLTVGFGDLCATNKNQALCLIFIETISCITLAYNISCVGAIIGQMKAENEEKKKKLKYVHRMCQENKISEDLQQKINNYIQESYLVNQQFQLQKFEDLLNSLPKSIQSEYRKQANHSIFNVGFFNSLNNKTILALAQYVIRKVAHPMQIIQKKGQIQQFCILKKGSLGFACKNGVRSLLNNKVIQKFECLVDQNPKILSLGFIKRKQLTYDIKSLSYSVYYCLTFQELIKVLKVCQMDYQFFLYMKDKDDIILGSNEIQKCFLCKDDYHSLFECPQKHYHPLKQLIISNYLNRQKKSKNVRQYFDRMNKNYRFNRSLYNYLQVNQDQQKYLRQNFEEDQILQIKNIKKYYYQKEVTQINKGHLQKIFSIKNSSKVLQSQFQKIEQILTKIANSQVQFWQKQLDCAHSFKYYFKQHNPNRLIKFKMYSHKRKIQDMIFGIYAHKKLPHNPAINKVTKRIFSTFLQNQDSNYDSLNTNPKNIQTQYSNLSLIKQL